MSNDNSTEKRPTVKELGGLKAECFLDRIILTWNTPEGKGDIFCQVYLKDNSDPDSFWDVQDVKTPGTHTLEELTPETEYLIFVRAFNDSGPIGTFPADDAQLAVKTTLSEEETAVETTDETTNETTDETVKETVEETVKETVEETVEETGDETGESDSDDTTEPEPIKQESSTATLKVTTATAHTLGFRWEKIEGKDVRYNAYMKEAKDAEWRQVARACTDLGGISSCALKPDTQYGFYYEAVDGTGKVLRREECTARTSDKLLKVSNITSDGFTIEWEPLDIAKHKETIYGVYLGGEGPGTAWCRQFKGISSYTYTGLKQGVDYTTLVYVYGPDGKTVFYYEADGDVRILPLTTPDRLNRLDLTVRQGAKYLPGTDCIRLNLEYSIAKYDPNGKVLERKTEKWSRKWSKGGTTSDIIQLPEGWYFEDNQVHLLIESRKAASAGLNKWKKCSEGDVSIKGGSLMLQLFGNYFSYNVQFTIV